MNAELLRKGSRMNIGKERYIVSMFVDMRGSTKLAERDCRSMSYSSSTDSWARALRLRSMRAANPTNSSATGCWLFSELKWTRRPLAARRCVLPPMLPPTWTT